MICSCSQKVIYKESLQSPQSNQLQESSYIYLVMHIGKIRLHKVPKGGGYLPPVRKHPPNLNLESANVYVQINQEKVEEQSQKSSRKLETFSNLHSIKIEGNTFDPFKEFPENRQQLKSPPKESMQTSPFNLPQTHKITSNQILQVSNEQAKKNSLKNHTKQSLLRRISSNQDHDAQGKSIESAYQELQSLSHIQPFASNRKMAEIVSDKVQKTLGLKFAWVIDESLKNLLSKSMTKEEVKNFICRQMLISCLTIIRLYHESQPKLREAVSKPLQKMSEISRNILSYLKTKYPRAKNLFVPYELNKKFQQINFLTLAENNILQNAGYSFIGGSSTRRQIIARTKRFFNTVLDELEAHYPKFTELLTQKVFILQNAKEMARIKMKIGRKLPEDTQKYFDFDTDNMEITSPQVFRVMIKWIEQMENLLIDPSVVISKRKGIKCVKFDVDDKPIFSEIRSKRFLEIKVDLIEKISDSNQYETQIKKLLNTLHSFNNSLTRTLNARQCDSAFVKEEEAQCLKFAKFDTQFLEWLIVEKFVITIQILTKLSEHFERKLFKKLDLINFSVYDLMRGSFSGKRLQILQVYENLRKLEQEGVLSIVRLKNRLSTPLNDVLINFKMKQSFVVCELQLILSDVLQEGEEKMKSMEDINHTIYELQRSPYGPLSEMALTLGYNDPGIDYEKQIVFKEDWFKEQICSTGQTHEFKEIYDQTVPFVCSWCVTFYARLENFFEYHQCSHCDLKKCKACVFQTDRDQQKKSYFKYFISTSQGIPIQDVQSQGQEFLDNFIENKMAFVDSNYMRVRDHVNTKDKLKLQSIQKVLYHKQSQKGLRGSDPLYSILLHFGDGQCKIEVLKYVDYRAHICGKNPKYEANFKIQKYDVLFFLKENTISPSTHRQKYEGLYRLKSESIKEQLYDVTIAAKVRIKASNSKVVYYSHRKNKYLLEVIQTGFSKDKEEAEYGISKATEKIISDCQAYSLARKQITLVDIGLQNPHLGLLQQKSWSSQILVLNLSKNKLSMIFPIVNKFKNLEELYLSHNALSQLNLSQQKNSTLSILDVSDNKIQKVPESINNYSNLTVLCVDNNLISSIPVMNLLFLQTLDFDENKIQCFDNLVASKLPELTILQTSGNENKNGSWLLKLAFPNLHRISARRMESKFEGIKLNLQKMPNLEFIDLTSNSITELDPINLKNLREVTIAKNKISNISNVFSDKLIHLKSIVLCVNVIKQFPLLQLDSLLTLDISHCQLSSLQNLVNCYLHKLEVLKLDFNLLSDINALSKANLPAVKRIQLNNNSIQSVPEISFPKLEILNLKFNKILDISSLSKASLPSLITLNLVNNKIKKIPMISLECVTEFMFSTNQIEDIQALSQVVIPKITRLALYKNMLTDFPQLSCPTLKIISLNQNKLKDISRLASSKIQNIKFIQLLSNEIQWLPVFSFPQLQKLHLKSNKICNIESMSDWETPRLKYIDLSDNLIQEVPKIFFKTLHFFQLSNNKIKNFSTFPQSKLPSLKTLKVFKNPFQTIPPLFFKSLEYLDVSFCKIKDIASFIRESKLPNICDINLNFNFIQYVPPQFSFPLIQTLSLKSNKITRFSIENTENFKNLDNLNLVNNKLECFDFRILEKCLLARLSLSKNPLKSWEYSQQARIKKLFLVECELKSIDSLYLPKVEQIYVQKNNLQSINFVSEPGSMVSLQRLVLESNLLKKLPIFETPNLIELLASQNPFESIDEFLQSQLPKLRMIKFKLQKNQSTGNISNKSNDVEVISNVGESRIGGLDELANSKSVNQEDQTRMKIPLSKVASSVSQETKQQFKRKLLEKFPNVKVQI